jgi:glycosyltransferase involved in cell wall biosynthesis
VVTPARTPIRILIDSFADDGLPNAQMGNAREIACRLDPDKFHVTMFLAGEPDKRLARRPNTRLVRLPARRQTVKILRELVWGDDEIVFYLKSSPASLAYMRLRRAWNDGKVVSGTMESQSDLRNEPTIKANAIRMWEQTILKCDHLFSNSRSVQTGLKREYGIDSDIVPTGVDTNYFTPDYHRQPNARPRVLFVGSLRPFKQPQLLLEAASRFPQADFRIAGDGPLAPELKDRAKREHLSNLMLLGPLTAPQLREEYRAADIFLFPSTWEGSPKVILEAAASGLPVVARNTYSPETVVQGVTGYQAASDSKIFSFVDALLSSHELRAKLGRNGRQHSLRYDWDVITRQWVEIFESLSVRKQRKAS